MTKQEKKLKSIEAYVKDKMKLFRKGSTDRSKGIMQVLQAIKYILDE